MPDLLPHEPGGYNGFQALFGHRYVAPQLGAGTPNLTHNGYQVTNAAGNLVDENGNQINGAFLTNHPGFPGFGSINASQTLAYMADMLEAGVPVVNGYIADIHGNEDIPGLAACKGAPAALGSGTACYIAQAQYYNAAFGTFFKRLAADGITPANTLFVLSSDEGDHEAGANVGRAIQPTPANCDGVTVACTYPAGLVRRAGRQHHRPAGHPEEQHHPVQPGGRHRAGVLRHRRPGPERAAVRTLERDVAGLTANNPYAGGTQKIANYLADPAEEAILHMVNADPARTPTFALFAKPDYFLSPRPGHLLAVRHPEHRVRLGSRRLRRRDQHQLRRLRRPRRQAPRPGRHHGGRRPELRRARTAARWSSPTAAPPGTWIDETDIRPTLMYLTGLKDDYEHDGRVVTEILSHPNHALRGAGVTSLGACYKQLNSSVGQFGNFTLQASTAAVESSTPGDGEYKTVNAALTGLDRLRDALALRVKGELEAAAFGDQPVIGAPGQTAACQAIIAAAGVLAKHL